MWYFGLFLGMLALVAGLLYRVRLTRSIRGPAAGVTDDMVRQIEASGRIEFDEPLDLEQIQEEEARFWEERAWEESEEW
jgi:hypothetical protein